MSITPFGFTPTQDAVFWALNRLRQATGYALARETGIARANVYHALDVLAKRGLATASQGRPAVYRATSAEASLALLAEAVGRELADVSKELKVRPQGTASRPRAGSADGFLLARSAVVAEALRCVADARQELLAVVGPWVPELWPALAESRRRGVAIRAVSLGLPAPEGALVRVVSHPELEAYWGGLPLAVVGDRHRAVCGVLSRESGSGLATSDAGVVPFLRHLLRRELATAAAPRVS